MKRIPGVGKSDIRSGMQLVLKHPDTVELHQKPGLPSHSDWGMRAVSMSEWLALWAPIYAIELLHPRRPNGTNSFTSKIEANLLGVRFATGCELFRHGTAHLTQSGGVISVQRLRSGFAAIEFPDYNYVQRPDVITITDHKQTFRGSHHNAEVEQVIIPRSVLGLTDADPISPVKIDLESERGRRLAIQLDRFFDDDRPHSFEAENLSALLMSEIRESWAPISDREEWWIGRRNLIRKYIDTHLEDPNLGPLQICQLFNMSRATLYRMFEPDGGVRRRIQDRRLFSAIWDLATSGIRRGRLSQVSERWGFSSDANFNRAVKLAFGQPPGTLFKTGYSADKQSENTNPVSDPLIDWFRTHKMGEPDSDIPAS